MKHNLFYFLLVYMSIVSSTAKIGYELIMTEANEEIPIVVVIPSYNNEKWCVKNISSILNQNYSNYHIIYVDDCSRDNTHTIVKDYIDKHDAYNRVTLIQNKTRCGAMANLYNMIHSCPDDAIIATVDGDDWLPDQHVLSYINSVYKNNDVWLTYGQFISNPSGRLGKRYNCPFDEEIIKNNSFRNTCLPISHLRTFKAWLFKLIKLQDLFYEGKFLSMTWDKAIMAPMIEMAGEKHKCLDRVLYVYNEQNPINDHKVDVKLQSRLASMILSKKPYNRVKNKPELSSRYKEQTIDIVIFSSDIHKIKKVIDDLYLKLIHKEKIWIIYDQDQVSYQNLLSQYPDIIGVNAIEDYQQACKNCFNQIEADYVILTTDSIDIPQVDLKNAVNKLESTQAFCFVLDPACDLSCENFLWDGLCAWQCKMMQPPLNEPYKGDFNLYRKEHIKSLLNSLSQYKDFNDLLDLMNKQPFKKEQITIGLRKK